MADLRIVDAPLLSTVKGTEKIPTGGEGNFSVSVNQVADFAKLKWFLATEEYVDNAVGNVQADLNLHKNNSSNPHGVTKVQVGLGNVDNTADLDKPVSNATQSAIITANSGKADKSYVDSQDNLKADKTTVEASLLLKADKVDLTASKIASDSSQNQQQINDFGGAKWYAKVGGYELGATVKLANGDTVQSTKPANTVNPNVDMKGWVKPNSAGQIFDASGKSQQVINDRIEIIRDSAVILESYKPAYSTEKLSNRFSTLAEAKAVYPSARNLTDYVDLTVLQQAINDANGRRVITKSGRDLYLNTVGVSPDGHAGEYCLLASNAVELRPDGSTRTRLIVPSDTHGLIGMSDDITVDNIHFYGDAVATSDIGHMIKFIKCKRPKVLNSKFTNVSDVAVNFGYNYTQAAAAMDIAIANGQLATFDMFQFGSSDFEYIGNIVDDCYGDGGIEVQASVRGKITRNDHRNCRHHGYRIVGCKDTDIYNNHGADLGTASTFSAMLSLFSGALTRNGNVAWMYNEDLRVYSNTGDNVKDSIHMGLGGLNLSVFDNEIGAWNRGLYIFHTNPTCRYGLKDSRVYRNKLRGAKGKGQVYGAHLAVGVTTTKPLQGALLDNVSITDNDFDFSLKACYTDSQTVDHKIINSKIRNRYFTATSTSVASSATGTTLDFVESTDLSDGSNNIENGTELVVTTPSGTNLYGRRNELKFTRSGDTLVMQSRSDIKTGQLVTLRFTSGSVLPAPLAINTPYYLIVVDTKTVKLATSLANAFAGTSITLTSDTVLHNFMTFI